MTSEFHRLWALGYRRLVPIVPPDAEVSERSTLFKRIGTPQDGRGKTPGIRGWDGKWSSFNWTDHEADEHDLDRWAAMGAGVGIKTGDQGDGTWLVPIDADTLDIGHARTIKGQIDAMMGDLPARVGQSPKALYMCRVRGRLPYSRIEFGNERVEVLSDGKQMVAAGIHPKTRKPYSWPRELVPYADLPVFEPETVLQLLSDLRTALPEASRVISEGAATEVSQASLTGPLEAVRAAVSAIPNNSNLFPSRESYLAVGYAIKAALPDHPTEAFELFSEWCDRWVGGHNDPEVVRSDWLRMRPPYRRGASQLYEWAEEYGDFSRAMVYWEPPVESEIFLNHFSVNEAEKPEPRRLNFVTLQEAAASALTASTKPLIKGLLDQGTLSVMYGPSNVGKSFVALDMFFHIAAGMPWGGMRTQQGNVVYVAAEGGAGARKRADALMRRYPGKIGLNAFHMLLSGVDLLRPDADLQPLISAILEVGPVSAVGLDTLSRVMAGGEENSSVDMGAMVKHFDKIRQATGAHVMLVHHSGKDQAKGARGHSLLRAATDTEVEIAEGSIAVTKQRDLDKAYSTAFRLEVVELGVDADGEPVTSCTVTLAPRQAALASPLTPTEQSVLEALLIVLSSSGDAAKGARAADVAAFMEEAGMDKMSAETVRAHLKNMARKGAVMCPNRGFWAQKAEFPLSVYDTRALEKAEESGRESGISVFE